MRIYALNLGIGLVSFFYSCQGGNSHVNANKNITRTASSRDGIRILDYDYINDTLSLIITDFRIVKVNDTSCKLDIYLNTSQPDLYSKGHRFFVHAYTDNSTEKEGRFLSYDTNKIILYGEELVFSRRFSSQYDYFQKIQYGLAQKTDFGYKRLFSLRLDSVRIK